MLANLLILLGIAAHGLGEVTMAPRPRTMACAKDSANG